MPKELRLYLISGAFGIALVVAMILVWTALSAPPEAVDAFAIPEQKPLTDSAKPIEGWYICGDLGIGPVPGRVNPRQRFLLCHPDGWELKTFCMNPDLPNPPMGTQCTRIGEDVYWCGNGVQPIREYIEPPPPTPIPPTETPTPTPTNTPTPTPTFTPTPTPTERPNPGGPGFRDLLNGRVFPAQPTPTEAPPGSYHPSQEVGTLNLPSAQFYGIDFNNHNEWVRIKIIPLDKRVNNGKPIQISFIPGLHCEFGSHTACVNAAKSSEGGGTIFLTIHSGIGGEAQSYRHAMEGTGYDQAAFNLNKILKNVRALAGAEVLIYQGDKELSGFTLSVASRVPSKSAKTYFELPLPEALNLAAGVDPFLAPYVNPVQPQIVFETCGWRVPGEKWVRGLRNTRSSVYIGVIQKTP